MAEFKIKLGVEAEDKITGFKGIVVGVSRYLTGCDQYCLKPRVNDKGQIEKGQWFDEGEIKKIGPGIHKKEVKSRAKGGPQREAPSM